MQRTIHIAIALAAILLIAAAPAAAGSAGYADQAGVPPTQLALLRHSTQAFAAPDAASRQLGLVSRARPITGERTQLPVIAQATDGRGSAWLEVLLPGRPNGHTGWIAASASSPGIDDWQINVTISTRKVRVLHQGRLVHTFLAVVGKPSTPTPVGRFFVEETVRLGAQDVGGPYALALSARSSVLQEFDGGPGQIALHGKGNLGGVSGTAASHGCVRLDSRDITWLAARIEPGTLVAITR